MPEGKSEKPMLRSTRIARSAITSFWILFLFVSLGFIAVISMTAFQLQHQIRSTTVENRALTIWEVSRIYENWTALKRTLESDQQRLQSALEKQTILRTELGEASNKLSSSSLLFDKKAHDIVQIAAEFAEFEQSEINCEKYSSVTEENSCHRIITKYSLDSILGNSSDNNSVKNVEEYKDLSDKITSLEVAFNEKYNAVERISDDIYNINKNISESSDKMKYILSSDNNAISFTMGDFLDAKRFLQGIESTWFVPDFSLMPPDMLTLFLVMAMGGLGGAIHLSQLYLKQLNDGPSAIEAYGARYFLLRPFLGAITAIAVFILTKAGVLVIAAGDGQGAAVSPFFVAFLGIISGLLADRALLMIQTAGHRVFSNADDQKVDRWAYGLKTALEALPGEFEKNKEALAQSLEVSVQKIDDWLAETEAVPEDTQRDISLFTHQSKGLLFRDLKA
ncbi:hypothetical protein [Martelella radicis]|uniref:Uncharacterized protein n=1 Tax=Martelella radicis TaxID=1397476 RepID=A0A7W6KK48_9HYPH|nr:hypothetical protein [Martelella radicis]MBB4121370.1 hypothetical protein [Martelella radicis]